MKRGFTLFFFLFLFGCGRQEVLSSQIYVYGTDISINLYEGKKDDLNKVKDIFYHYYYLADYENERELVNVYTLNKKAYNEEVIVSEDFFNMLSAGIECYELTNGNCNIAIGAASYKWHDMIDEKNNNISVLQNETNNVSINDIILNRDNLSVRFKNENLKIDLGSIAKGYALREAISYLKEKEIEKYIINAGTSSIGVGKTQKDGDYNIHIIDPVNIADTFKSFSTSNKCISTSGDYQDYFEYEGKNYHHILNKDLGISHIYKSVTVIGDDAMIVDALSTGLFSINITDARSILEKSNCSAIFYLDDGTVVEI